MRYFRNENVLEAAKKRIRFVFSEFDNVFVAHSGGKDSTVTFELALEVAKELGRTPLPVLFVDQEAEFTQTIDVIKSVMYREDVEPHWLQCPIYIFNATSHDKDWIGCWEEGAEWLRDKDPISIKENNFGTTRIKDMFSYYPAHLFPKEPFAMLGGVRCEESPTRRAGLTGQATYKWVTWGKKLKKKNHYTFYPLYDWSYTDIWKAIHEHGWTYNEIYDQQYQYGCPVHKMRVSNLHHETSIHHLFYLQEVDPELYSKLAERIEGVSTATKFNDEFFVNELPPMFKDWREYRDFLLDKLIKSPEAKKAFRKEFDSQERIPWFFEPEICTRALKVHVNAIIANDWTGTKLANLRAAITGPKVRKKYEERFRQRQESRG